MITRFAPSPTKNLHLGHVYSARLAHDLAKREGGDFLLRIEDIDHTRCKPEFVEQIMGDLDWLGLDYSADVRYQSLHLEEYHAVLERLDKMGVIYPCFCTNAEIKAEIERAGQAPHEGEHSHYPGTCKKLSKDEVEEKIANGTPYALRLDLFMALGIVGHKVDPLTWQDQKAGGVIAKPEEFGDIILARKDIGTSYHISVVHDDYVQGVTDVVRGIDLFTTTHIHRVLQALLGYETPRYHHHALLIDPDTGRRFAKRDNPMTIKMMRESGMTPTQVFKLVDQYASIAAAGS